MNYDNIRGSMRSKNIAIVILVLIVIALSFGVVYLFLANQRLNKQLISKQIDESILSEADAKDIGIKLYDKATEIYEVYSKGLPYCGKSLSELKNVNKTKFEEEFAKLNESTTSTNNSKKEVKEDDEDDDDSKEDNEKTTKIEEIEEYKNDVDYYKSKYKDMTGLKEYLSNFLTETRVNEYTKVKPVKDLKLLSNESYINSNYVLYNNYIYCRVNDFSNDSKYIKNYSDSVEPYDIKTIKIKPSRITFIVTSKYLKDDITDFETECKEDISKCIKTDDQSFSIEKVDGVWQVSMFTLHE